MEKVLGKFQPLASSERGRNKLGPGEPRSLSDETRESNIWVESLGEGSRFVFCLPIGALRCVGSIGTDDYEVGETHCSSSSSRFTRNW